MGSEMCIRDRHVAPHPANPNFGPQTTVSESVFVGQGGERESETMVYRDIPPSFPRGREVVVAAAQGNVVPATVSEHHNSHFNNRDMHSTRDTGLRHPRM